MNKFDEMREAVAEAKTTISAADSCVRVMAELCAGRLRRAEIPQSVLRRLKNELRDYNPHTGRWK